MVLAKRAGNLLRGPVVAEPRRYVGAQGRSLGQQARLGAFGAAPSPIVRIHATVFPQAAIARDLAANRRGRTVQTAPNSADRLLGRQPTGDLLALGAAERPGTTSLGSLVDPAKRQQDGVDGAGRRSDGFGDHGNAIAGLPAIPNLLPLLGRKTWATDLGHDA